jgi:dienelactone hydrolase
MAAAQRDLKQRDDLADFDARELTFLGQARTVYVAGQGPAVIVMSEMPGITPHVARFARRVRDAGFTVWMPHLFGDDGAPMTQPAATMTILRGCISAEFRAFAANASSPLIDWLRELAVHAFPLCGGQGVGAIGMCFTGNFALSMMLEPAVLAPVLSQPSLPLDDPGGLEISDEELASVRQRMEREDLSVLGLRFEGDRFCSGQRFAAYADALGDRFLQRLLPDAAANAEVPPFTAAYVPTPHSVVTVHLVDEAGHPTLAARDEILAFFRMRLGVDAGDIARADDQAAD